MDGLPNNNLGSAPPPPPEVKVRTMRSDLAAMTKSGGGLPRFESVKVPGLTPDPQAGADAPKDVKKGGGFIFALTFAILVVLSAVGYFVYATFFAQKNSAPLSSHGSTLPVNPIPAPTPTPQSSSSAQAAVPVPLQKTPFIHASLLKKPADAILTLTFSSGGAASSATDLKTFNQKLLGALESAPLKIKNAPSSTIEIVMKDTNGNGLPVSDIMAVANESILDPQALAAHFNPDATFFAYHDKNGWWPGYVIALKPLDNWLFSSADVARLESSPNIPNFFLNNPGASSPDGFTDSMSAGVKVRVLPFLTASVPTYFVYGWSGANLILSASRNGFMQAASRL